MIDDGLSVGEREMEERFAAEPDVARRWRVSDDIGDAECAGWRGETALQIFDHRRDDVGAEIVRAGGEFDVLHPEEIAARRIVEELWLCALEKRFKRGAEWRGARYA